MKNILILGATSTLAAKTAELYAAKGASFSLVARNTEKLDTMKKHLTVLGAKSIQCIDFDFVNIDNIEPMLQNTWEQSGSFDLVIVAHGTLTEQNLAQQDLNYFSQEFRLNAESVLVAMTVIANKLEQQKHGSLAVFGSVAGDRGRPSNYAYGCTKAAIEAFAEGMRARLYKAGVHLLLIKPGIIRTNMTAGLDDLPERLVSEPIVVANDIVKALDKKKNIIYTPGYWGLIMLIIKCIPHFMFKKLNL